MDLRNKLLIVLLIIQLAIVGFFFMREESSTPNAVQFFSGLSSADLLALTLAEADGKKISLARDPSQPWGVDIGLPDFYPANESKIDDFVNKIIMLQSTRLVAKTSSSHSRLKVAADEFNRRLELTFKGGISRVLFLGTSPNYNTTHVRDQGSDTVFLVDELASWEADTDESAWIQHDYLSLDVEKLTALKLSNSHGFFTLQKTDSRWRLPTDLTRDLDQDLLATFLQTATHISMDQVVTANDSIPPHDPPVAILDLNTEDEAIQIQIWETHTDDSYFIKSSLSTFYVKVSSTKINPLVDQPLL